MIICVCHRVSHHDIARAVSEGCASFEELQFELQVATGCGACRDCAVETFEAHGCPGAQAGRSSHTSPAGHAPYGSHLVAHAGAGERAAQSVRRLIPVQALAAQAAGA